MKFLHYSIFGLITILAFSSCSREEFKFKINTPEKTILGEEATLNLEQLSDEVVDSVQFFIGKKRILDTDDKKLNVNSNQIGVGRHVVTALVFTQNKVSKVTDSLKIYANRKPIGYRYEIVNRYLHDKKAYTQGLEFYNGELYETTGRVGESFLRKVDYTTGAVLKQQQLSNYFGEGMTIVNNSLYWLTWLGGKGFIFNPETFEKTGEFDYKESMQGWGLTHDEKSLIKSDGSNKLYFLNYKGEEQRVIQAYTIFRDTKGTNPRASNIDELNEIEFLDGKIYANRWQTDQIAVIDAETGILDGIVNIKELRKEIEKEQVLDADEVLNGIAYNIKTKTFFVTGKHWGKLFEIKIFK